MFPYTYVLMKIEQARADSYVDTLLNLGSEIYRIHYFPPLETKEALYRSACFTGLQRYKRVSWLLPQPTRYL